MPALVLELGQSHSVVLSCWVLSFTSSSPFVQLQQRVGRSSFAPIQLLKATAERAWDVCPDDAQAPILVLGSSTRFLSPAPKAIRQPETKPGWQHGQEWLVPAAPTAEIGTPPLHGSSSFRCGFMRWGSFIIVISCSDLKQAPRLLSELKS